MRYKNTFIRLEQELFNRLEKSVSGHNLHYDEADKNKISMDKAVFFINYISLKKFQNQDKLVNGYVRLHSEILNNYLNDDLKKYRIFLTNKGYVKTIPYNVDEQKSFGYKVLPLIEKETSKKQKRKYISYEFINRSYEDFLNKRIDKTERLTKRKKAADRNTKHLTKWLNGDNLKIDWGNAYKWIEQNQVLKDEEKFFYSYTVEKIRFEIWHYSRSGKDNRLHSNLTNLPSDLRQFISTNDSSLVSLDVETSQPYMFAGVLNLLIVNKDRLIKLSNLIKCKFVKDKLLSLMNLISLEPLIITDFKAYIKLICKTDVYQHTAGKLSTDFIDTITSKSDEYAFEDSIRNTATNKTETKGFKSLRAYCKTLTLEYLYCSIENSLERIKQIRTIYPKAVNKFIHDFKYCKELEVPKNKRTKMQRKKIIKSKKLFPKFLQQLEAGIMLDTITKELSKIHPKMFMATIHDSIV
ncbi:MAG: hypothetical protein ACWIPJ_10585, partial [Polaribacter sp.]